MRFRFLIPTLPAFMFLFPLPALACDFGYISFPQLYENASAIFIGKVVESPWKQDGDGKVVITGRNSIRLRIERVLRGTEKGEVSIAYGSDCTFTFLEGEVYLVHATRMKDGRLAADQPSRPLLLADAEEALKYVEAAVANRAPGVVWGAINVNGRLVLQDSSARRVQRDVKPGFYEIVVAPGEYTVWIERDGKVISTRKAVRLTAGNSVTPLLEVQVDK
jgi:hypothetical protein